jgi:hypothetical protein
MSFSQIQTYIDKKFSWIPRNFCYNSVQHTKCMEVKTHKEFRKHPCCQILSKCNTYYTAQKKQPWVTDFFRDNKNRILSSQMITRADNHNLGTYNACALYNNIAVRDIGSQRRTQTIRTTNMLRGTTV